MNRKAILMSIKPFFAERILSGEKTVELRRVCPKVSAGDLVVIYASGPRMALIGGFEVGGVVSGTPESIYRKYGKAAHVTRREFDSYFAGTKAAFGIMIAKAWAFDEETELKSLRRRVKGFHPPQSYRYLQGRELALMCSRTDSSHSTKRVRLSPTVAPFCAKTQLEQTRGTR